MRAADLFEQGVIPAEVARQVGVSHQIVSDWRAAWRRSGRDGLRGASRAARLPKLSRDQLVQVERELIKGAEANGYPNDVWTLRRVAEVIERLTARRITRRTSGSSCAANSSGAGSGRHAEPASATTTPSTSG